jgi:glucose/arabinose dehydrogenase
VKQYFKMGSKSQLSLLFLASLLSYAVGQTLVGTTAPYVQQVYVPNITRPRHMVLDAAGDVLVTSATQSRVTAIRETPNANGTVTVTTTIIIDGAGLGLNHGIAISGGWLYASSATQVFRWPYTAGSFSLISQALRQLVIQGIPAVQGHTTRSLLFDPQGRLYVTIGTQTNATPSPHRSRILRFTVTGALPIAFGSGEIIATGCRNTLGIGFNLAGTLFAVDMGADQLNRPDIGAIWGQNPGDEMNRIDLPFGRHYGFPECWSSYNLPGQPRASQWAWPNAGANLTAMDIWCRNPATNVPSVLSFPAHASPMSIEFYAGQNCGVAGGFPCSAVGSAVVTLRGGWHTGIPHGYEVVMYPFNNAAQTPTGQEIRVLFSTVAQNSCNSCLRPAGSIFNRNGHLLVSADSTHQIFRVAHNTVLPTIINVNV